MSSLFVKTIVRLRAARLDVDLATGSAPEASPQLSARARTLASPKSRASLAQNWEHLLSVSRTRPQSRVNRAPICRERLDRSEHEIRELVSALREAGPMPARGVAIARTLLSDGRGPVYNPQAPDDLADRLSLALEWLNPAEPLMN